MPRTEILPLCILRGVALIRGHKFAGLFRAGDLTAQNNGSRLGGLMTLTKMASFIALGEVPMTYFACAPLVAPILSLPSLLRPWRWTIAFHCGVNVASNWWVSTACWGWFVNHSTKFHWCVSSRFSSILVVAPSSLAVYLGSDLAQYPLWTEASGLSIFVWVCKRRQQKDIK